MKHILLNLKRFDIPYAMKGVNRVSETKNWGEYIINSIASGILKYNSLNADFSVFFPEAHVVSAVQANEKVGGYINIGCQGVFREDAGDGGNFGAFTTNRPATSMVALGCKSTIIGHCEERKDLEGIFAEAGLIDSNAINRLLNKEIIKAQNSGMQVVYCIGEKSEEKLNWRDVLSKQLELGLKNVNMDKVVVAYEPIWSIGPGNISASKEYISEVSNYIKQQTGNVDVVYGGGLKKDNASTIASIDNIDGGLIALTRFDGDIGFYPDEYLEIVKMYLEH